MFLECCTSLCIYSFNTSFSVCTLLAIIAVCRYHMPIKQLQEENLFHYLHSAEVLRVSSTTEYKATTMWNATATTDHTCTYCTIRWCVTLHGGWARNMIQVEGRKLNFRYSGLDSHSLESFYSLSAAVDVLRLLLTPFSLPLCAVFNNTWGGQRASSYCDMYMPMDILPYLTVRYMWPAYVTALLLYSALPGSLPTSAKSR